MCFRNTQNRLHVYHSNIASVNSFNSLRKMKFLHHHIYCFVMAIIFRCWMKNVRIAKLGKLRTIHCLIGKTTTAWSVMNNINLQMFTKAITNVCVWLMCYTCKASHYKSQQNIESAYREVRHCCFLRGKIFDENLNSKRLWSNFMFYLLTKISSILRWFLVFHNCPIETNYQINIHWLLFQ